MQVFVWTDVFISLGSGTSGSYGKSMFGISRTCQMVSSGCSVLHSQQPCVRVPACPHSPPDVSLAVATLHEAVAAVVLICISLVMVSFVSWVLAIYFSLVSGLLESAAHLLIGSFVYFLLNYERFLYVLDTSPLPGM